MTHLGVFTPEEIEQVREEAKAEARQLLKEELVKRLFSGVQPALVEVEPKPVSVQEVQAELEAETEKEDWVIAPTPSDSETFGEVEMYGHKFRVNKTGTVVKAFVHGRWKVRKIQEVKTRNTCVPYVNATLGTCAVSKSKRGQITVSVALLVLKAFKEVPEYIAKVESNPNGQLIMFGLKLYSFNDQNVKNLHASNVEWISRDNFMMAVKSKVARLQRD